MILTQFESENAIPEVMPVYDDLASAEFRDKPHNGECRYTRRILAFKVTVAAFNHVHRRFRRTTYLHENKLRRVGNADGEGIQNFSHLPEDFQRTSNDERKFSQDAGGLRKVNDRDVWLGKERGNWI